MLTRVEERGKEEEKNGGYPLNARSHSGAAGGRVRRAERGGIKAVSEPSFGERKGLMMMTDQNVVVN
jgi:hypothetical protein